MLSITNIDQSDMKQLFHPDVHPFETATLKRRLLLAPLVIADPTTGLRDLCQELDRDPSTGVTILSTQVLSHLVKGRVDDEFFCNSGQLAYERFREVSEKVARTIFGAADFRTVDYSRPPILFTDLISERLVFELGHYGERVPLIIMRESADVMFDAYQRQWMEFRAHRSEGILSSIGNPLSYIDWRGGLNLAFFQRYHNDIMTMAMKSAVDVMFVPKHKSLAHSSSGERLIDALRTKGRRSNPSVGK